MKTLKILILLFLVTTGQCFALREIATLTKKEAKETGIEVRVHESGADAVRFEIEFKPDGKLKEFSHVELKMADGGNSFIFSGALRETRSASGNVIVGFTASRAYLEKTTISVVLRSRGELGDHAYQLQAKEFATIDKGP